MTWDVLIAATVGGLAGSVVQGAVHWWTAQDQINAQDDRRVGEIYLQQKVDILTEYHSELVTVFEELELYRSKAYNDELSQEEFEGEFTEMFDFFYHTSSRATVFLDDEQRDTLDETVDAFRDAYTHIRRVRENEEEEERKFIKPSWFRERQETAMEGAREIVEKEIRQGVSRLES